MTLKFGIFDHMERLDGSLSELYNQRLEYLERADAAGFWCYHKAEHHFVPLDSAPSANVFLAAASQRTRNIRFGPLVYLLPFYHPLRLYEEICQLDHLSGGRLELGVGRGISPPEHAMWGHDPEQARSRSEETLEILNKSFGADTLTHHGQHFTFDAAQIEMQPAQSPHPRLWYPGNIEFTAKHRLNLVVKGGAKEVAQAVQQYGEVASQTENQGRFNQRSDEPIIGSSRHMVIAETDSEAQSRARQAYAVFHKNLATLFSRYGLTPPLDPTAGGNFDKASELELVLAGSPATVREKVEEYASLSGSKYYICTFAWGDLNHQEYMRSLELFASEVMPHFNEVSSFKHRA